MTAEIEEQVAAFLGEVMPAFLGTVRPDGTAQVVPIWYEYADGAVWLNPTASRGWLAHIRRDPRVTLLFVDPREMFRRVVVRGRVTDIDEVAGAVHIDRLARRYLGTDYPWHEPDDPRIRVRVDIESLTASLGDDGE